MYASVAAGSEVAESVNRISWMATVRIDPVMTVFKFRLAVLHEIAAVCCWGFLCSFGLVEMCDSLLNVLKTALQHVVVIGRPTLSERTTVSVARSLAIRTLTDNDSLTRWTGITHWTLHSGFTRSAAVACVAHHTPFTNRTRCSVRAGLSL